VAALAHLIAGQLQVSSSAVTHEARFVEDLGAEPMHLTDMVLAIEEHFEIDVDESDADRLHTLADVLAYLELRGYPADP